MDDRLLKGLFDNGLMGIEIPEEYGGAGSNFMTSILAVEEIAKVDPAVSVLVDIQNTLINSLINRLGTKAQKEQYLTKLATESVGDARNSFPIEILSQFFRLAVSRCPNHRQGPTPSRLRRQRRKTARTIS